MQAEVQTLFSFWIGFSACYAILKCRLSDGIERYFEIKGARHDDTVQTELRFLFGAK